MTPAGPTATRRTPPRAVAGTTAAATDGETYRGAGPVVGDGTTAGSRWAARWRSVRLPLALAGLLVGAAVLTVAVTGSVGGGDLDPDSAEPTGSRAVANVLRDQGVEVLRHERVTPALRSAGRGSTLLVVDAHVLGREQLESLAGSGADLVLVLPDDDVLAELAPQLENAGEEPGPATVADAACTDEDARVAGRATSGGRLLRAAGDAATVCFPDHDGQVEAGTPGSYAVTTTDDHLVRVIGQPAVLHNRSIDDHGNAALALRALGKHPRLVWLMADPLDGGTQQPAVGDLLPRWVPWVAAHCLLVVLALATWQGRRLGPLVREPLPVVVRSAETSEGRATLYRRAGAHDRAGQVLRAAALARSCRRLGLPAGTPAEQVAAAVAGAVDADPVAVTALLAGPPVPTAAALVRLADDLDALEALLAPGRYGPARAPTATRLLGRGEPGVSNEPARSDEAPHVPESETP